jgi:hypothetical protein
VRGFVAEEGAFAARRDEAGAMVAEGRWVGGARGEGLPRLAMLELFEPNSQQR